jgi:hypothetical protein
MSCLLRFKNFVSIDRHSILPAGSMNTLESSRVARSRSFKVRNHRQDYVGQCIVIARHSPTVYGGFIQVTDAGSTFTNHISTLISTNSKEIYVSNPGY